MSSTPKVDKLTQIYQFTNELGQRIEWTPSQKQIMEVILDTGAGGKSYVQIETPTRFGKSSSVAAALLMRCTMKERWAIVAGTADKAQIIMSYFINYALENTIPRELLKNTQALDKLKQERNKTKLTFSSGFEIEVFSADSRNKQSTGNAVMGFGAPYVILDEAALVDDDIEAKIFRMIAGFSATKHCYIKIGNPFKRNHFLKSHNDPDFHKIWWDYKVGIAEGRFTSEYIEKARNKPNFGVLYEVQFPDASAVDEKGWSNLLSEEDIRAVFVERGSGFGFLKVGIDPSGEGTNFTSVIKRYRNYAVKLLKERVIDQFKLTEWMVNWKNDVKRAEGILPLGYYVDKIGIGNGHYETLRRDLENVYGINVGVAPFDEEGFVNLRAENYWKLAQDIKTRKLSLEKDEDWFQLAQIKYRTKLEGKRGKIEIMSKEEMRANGIDSPDVADALALTYSHPDPYNSLDMGYETEDNKVESYDKYAPLNEIF